MAPALLLVTLTGPALAQKDAAEKVQEGNVNNWVEYYRKQREAAVGTPETASAASAEAEKSKGPRKAEQPNPVEANR